MSEKRFSYGETDLSMIKVVCFSGGKDSTDMLISLPTEELVDLFKKHGIDVE